MNKKPPLLVRKLRGLVNGKKDTTVTKKKVVKKVKKAKKSGY